MPVSGNGHEQPGRREQATERTVAPDKQAARGGLTGKISLLQARAAKAGFISSPHDDKAAMDEMWGED